MSLEIEPKEMSQKKRKKEMKRESERGKVNRKKKTFKQKPVEPWNLPSTPKANKTKEKEKATIRMCLLPSRFKVKRRIQTCFDRKAS